MYKLCWKEVNGSQKIVVKRKSFRTAEAYNHFVNQLWRKETFLGIILAG